MPSCAFKRKRRPRSRGHRSVSKERILELYFNQIYLGNGAYGIEAASQRYFGKTLKELNLAEIATLAALPKGPERYNPRKFPDRAVQRRNTVIALMRDEKIISTAQASEAQAYPLRLATRVESGDVAPYFVEWIRQQLDEKFGARRTSRGQPTPR
jgi:penicillin-binding protein 1A